MKKSEVTEEMFARWSFERDKKLGLAEGHERSFEDLDAEIRQLYLDEANAYFTHPTMKDDWPTDILNRLEENP